MLLGGSWVLSLPDATQIASLHFDFTNPRTSKRLFFFCFCKERLAAGGSIRNTSAYDCGDALRTGSTVQSLNQQNPELGPCDKGRNQNHWKHTTIEHCAAISSDLYALPMWFFVVEPNRRVVGTVAYLRPSPLCRFFLLPEFTRKYYSCHDIAFCAHRSYFVFFLFSLPTTDTVRRSGCRRLIEILIFPAHAACVP